MNNSFSKLTGIFFKLGCCLLWFFVFAVSSWHLLNIPFPDYITNETVGITGWSLFTVIILYLFRKHILFCSLVFFSFFMIGYSTGSYLEPNADPLDHLTNSFERCSSDISDVKRTNNGLWQYGMNSAVLCDKYKTQTIGNYIVKVDLLHGLYWGISAIILLLLALEVGFSRNLALLSVFIAFLFYGTNIFSYFRYYSFGPSFTSLLLFWIWIILHFFKRLTLKNYLFGFLTFITLLPVILVNHIQEAVFLFFLFIIYTLLHIAPLLFSQSTAERIVYTRNFLGFFINKKVAFGFLLFSFLFILPQFTFFREFLSSFFLHNYWQENQDVLIKWNDFHLFGNIFSKNHRIFDTLGLMGFLPVILVPILFIKNRDINGFDRRGRIFILGLLPFLVYCIPLFNFVWLSNCIRTPDHLRYYYRLCYGALAWLPIIYTIGCLVYLISHNRFTIYFSHKQTLHTRAITYFCLYSLILFASTYRLSPIYGKADFILLPSRPWWPEWQDIIHYSISRNNGEIYTDPVTGLVLSGVFGRDIQDSYRIAGNPIIIEKLENFHARQIPIPPAGPWVLLLENLQENFTSQLDGSLLEFANLQHETSICIINIRGFYPSWVGQETRHWHARTADTKWLYRYHYTHVKDLKDELKRSPLKHCKVFY